MSQNKSVTIRILGFLLFIELVLFLIGGVVVTNMDPFWMRLAVWSLPLLFYVTGAFFFALILGNQLRRD
ncbi:MAG: hypothetical protein ACXABY_15550 [Candidatus Thorarchaeota archaeon]|jgi:hypothetical protein